MLARCDPGYLSTLCRWYYWSGTSFIVDMAMVSICLRGGDTVAPDENTRVLGEMHNNSSQSNSACQPLEWQIMDYLVLGYHPQVNRC